MRQKSPIRAGIVAVLALLAAPVLADEDAAKKSFVAYLKAFGEADTAGMGGYYADEVTVLRGSTLLDERYGGLGGDDGKAKDQKVKKDRLLKAYDKAIEVFGGKSEWTQRYAKFKDEEIKFVTLTAEQAEKIKETGIKADDVIAVVIPKGDSMSFVLRKNEKAIWTIVAEHWD